MRRVNPTLARRPPRTIVSVSPLSAGTDGSELLNERQAARYLGLTGRTLAAWRSRNYGPAYAKLSARAIRYRRRDLDQWILRTLHSNAVQSES